MAMAVLQVPMQLEELSLSGRPPKQRQVDELEYEGVAAVVMEKEDHEEEEEDRPWQADVWKAIQATKAAAEPLLPPYVHPLVRRSSSSMSQRSLNTCTERLGSETGSDDFSDFLDDLELDLSSEAEKEHGEEEEEEAELDADDYTDQETEAPPLREVNYHRSNGKRSPERCFPPPLPSISSRHAPCLHVRPRRCDGRLVLNAVHAPCLNYLRAQREDGRLLLSFIGAPTDAAKTNTDQNQLEESEAVEEPEEEEEEEEEEEVEVFDRGTVVEFKVSQQQSGTGGAVKVLRSSIVINKFVGGGKCEGKKDTGQMQSNIAESPHASTPRRAPATTSATAAAAVVVTSTLSATGDGRGQLPEDNKLLFTSKKRDREEMLRSMRRCSELRMPLFIWDPCCIATS